MDCHYVIENEILLNHFKALRPFQSNEEARYYLCGALITNVGDKGLRLAATNGHILYEGIIDDVVNLGEIEEADIVAIIPRQAVDDLIKILTANKDQQCRITFIDGKFVHFDFYDCSYQTRVIDGSFPDYENVIPKDAKISTGFEPKYLKAAISALSNKAININFANDNSAHVLTSDSIDGVTCVVMPKRVGEL